MYQKIIFYLSFLLIMASCAGSGEPTITYDTSLSNFSITADASGKFQIPASITQSGRLFYVTVPQNADLKTLVLSFSVDKRSVATVEGKELIPDATFIDCSNTVTIAVSAEDGSQSSYDILVKNGIEDFDKKVYNFMSVYSIPGVSISVMKNNKVIYSYGFGYADKENKVRTTPNHLFRLASVSKQFTTICALTLVDEGKFKLDDRVFGPDGILGEKYKDVTGTKAEVTVRNFLQHQSGWISNPDPMFSSQFDGKTLDELIDYMLGIDQVTKPGEKYSYYNLGFGVIGKIIEKFSGMSFNDYLEQTMAKAGVYDVHEGKDRAGKRPNECVYYSQSGTNGYGNEMDVIAAAGGVIASTAEMMKLLPQIDGFDDSLYYLLGDIVAYNWPTM